MRPDDWPLVERLFGARGACGGCWCLHWHAPPGTAAWLGAKGEPNRKALQRQLLSGECHAVLAVRGEAPLAWCRTGPVASFPRLLRSRKLIRGDMADWAVVCFFVSPAERGKGLSGPLIEAAVAYAASHGARSIEAYPVVPKRDSVPAPFAWTGVPRMFEATGFEPVPHDAGGRRIYRKEIVS